MISVIVWFLLVIFVGAPFVALAWFIDLLTEDEGAKQR